MTNTHEKIYGSTEEQIKLTQCALALIYNPHYCYKRAVSSGRKIDPLDARAPKAMQMLWDGVPAGNTHTGARGAGPRAS